MTFCNRAALVLAALLTTSHTYAQDRPVITLNPADPARWDLATHVGWLGGNKSEIGPDWNGWYDAASVDVSAGYYWTRHLKFEVDLSTTSSGGLHVQELVTLPGDPFPYYQSREHTFRSTALAGGLTYQFLENAWFHPFIGGGLTVVHETHRSGPGQPAIYYRDALTRVLLPALRPIDDELTALRPFVATGFKVYVAERVFFRTDLRVTGSSQQAESVVWRGGVGFDF